MSDEPKKRRGAWIRWVPIAAFGLYVLSEGPACWIFRRYGGERMADAMNTAYEPLHWCARQSLFTEESYDSYLLFWSTH
jgi:hypothetical protein